MNSLVLLSILAGQLLGSMRITAYRSVTWQTDDSPFITSTGEHVCNDGVAASRDLLSSGALKYGDWVYVEGTGLRRVNDSLADSECVRWKHDKCVERKPIRNQLDLWVPSVDAESKVWKKYGNKPVKVWKVQFLEADK